MFLGAGKGHDSAIDLVALLGYYMCQMHSSGDEAALGRQEFPIRDDIHNGLTDAVCFSYVMEDEGVAEAFLSKYILNNQETAIHTFLEFSDKEYLYFKNSCR